MPAIDDVFYIDVGERLYHPVDALPYTGRGAGVPHRGAATIHELDAEVIAWEHTHPQTAEALGEDKGVEGQRVVELNPRGIRPRCGLAKLNAWGQTPRRPNRPIGLGGSAGPLCARVLAW